MVAVADVHKISEDLVVSEEERLFLAFRIKERRSLNKWEIRLAEFDSVFLVVCRRAKAILRVLYFHRDSVRRGVLNRKVERGSSASPFDVRFLLKIGTQATFTLYPQKPQE